MLVDIIYPITEDINFNINIKEQIYGGIDINDSSLGLNYQLWNISYIDNDIIITSTLNNKQYIVYTVEDASDISIAFDQNMNPWCLYQKEEQYYLYWYDVTINQYSLTLFENIVTPFMFMDLIGSIFSDQSSINIFYIKDGKIYCTQQSSRFTVQNLLYTFPTGTVKHKLIASGYLPYRLGLKAEYTSYEETYL